METVYRCKEHGIEFVDPKEAAQHIWDFHTPFKKSCLLNGKPSTGLCTSEGHYNTCQRPRLGNPEWVIKSNWMCWRDGILKDEQGG